MSNDEIVSVRDGNETVSADTGKDTNDMHSNWRPQGFGFTTKDFNPWVKVELIGGHHHALSQYLSPDKGHKHVSLLNPTPASVKPLLEKIKEPSLLLLQGCELLLQAHFPFEQFKTLTSLQISGISYLTAVPDAISEMTQLQALNLSHLPIKQFPSDEFFSNLTNLRSLVLRGCYNLHSLPPFPRLPALQCLDLSDLLIETFPLTDLSHSHTEELRWLILRGCSRLRSIPSLSYFEKLEVLDLSHGTSLQENKYIKLSHSNLQMVHLSYSALAMVIIHYCPHLTHLFARDIKRIYFYNLRSIPKLTMVDLSGAQILADVNYLERSYDLVAIDLSKTRIQSIDSLSDRIHLRHLVLKECTKLVNLPEMKRLTNLEVLDISGCEILANLPEDLNTLRNIKELNLSRCSGLRELREGLFDDMSCLEKLDLSKTNVNHLPSFASLTNLQTLNLSHTPVEKLPDLSNLINLKELLLENCQKLEDVTDIQRLTNLDKPDFGLPRNDGIDSIRVQSISNTDEFHLVSTFISESGFDRFKYEFTRIDILISNIEKKMKPTSPDKKMSQTCMKMLGSIRSDLIYVLKHVHLLESSSNCRSSEKLLHELVNVATDLSDDDFCLDSIDLSELIRVVAKLKLLVPPPKQVGGEGSDEEKKTKILLTSYNDKEEVNPQNPTSPDQNHLSSYDSLTEIERNCLLYFAIFSSKLTHGFYFPPIKVKERRLIQLWYGEGFIDPVLYANSMKQTQPTPNQNLHNPDPNPNTELVTSTYTITEIGQQILKVLEEKGFVKPGNQGFIKPGNHRREWCMEKPVCDSVKAKAKELKFFDFDDKIGNLTSHFRGSQRASLLKSQGHYSSSCQLWLRYANSSKRLESFKKIRTLLNVSESIIDLNVEWFSKMRNLTVLHLGSLNHKDDENVDVVDLKFLEELENMKQLRLLSLEGISAIVKLPDSVRKLTNLRMLNLKYCCNLDELPASIGSLENLTHLDLTYCHLLSMLPKGLMLLSKLEVLKGFMITYEAGGRQHTKACTLKELLKLKNLRKLNLVVNRDNFPYSKDLHALKEMKSLCNLKITWAENRYKGQEPEDSIGHEALRQSRWKQLKCWEQQTHQTDTEEPLRSNRLHDLKKLVMCCFPLETAPNWLHPSELQKLEKLYIVGGNLKTFPGVTDQNKWSVKSLHLKYLSKLDLNWRDATDHFPVMTAVKQSQCPHIRNFELVEWKIWSQKCQQGACEVVP